MNYTLHKFRPGETVDAVIRLRGRHNHTPQEILLLRKAFNELNGLIVPRAGQMFKIPLLDLVDDYGNVIPSHVEPLPIVSYELSVSQPSVDVAQD